ncbi:MAG: molybdate ABC transporter permease subunit, partial [Roseiarcus sp.]
MSKTPARPNGVVLAFWLVGSVLLAFILAPLIGLATVQSPANLVRVAAMPDVRLAIGLSLLAALLTTLWTALLGVPLAYVLARSEFPGKEIVDAIVDLPLAVPHTV